MTSLDQEVALLRGVPFLSSIEAGKLKLLAYSSIKLGFEDGEIVFRQGATDGDAYFILEGSVDVLTERNGREVRVEDIAVLLVNPAMHTSVMVDSVLPVTMASQRPLAMRW